jgi:hypothetical protein
MKTVVFGNPNTDWWKLTRDGVSRREQIVAITGELRAGFFSAVTPMCIPPTTLQTFAAELESLDKTLSGSATLQNANQQSEVSWVWSALPLGHIESSGRYTINGNNLTFSFRTDQTQLAPLLRWVRGLLTTYDNSNDAS